MKTRKTTPYKKEDKILKDVLGEKNIHHLMGGFATMADILTRYLLEKEDKESYPLQVKYAIVQTLSYLRVLWIAFHNPEEIEKGLDSHYFPSYNPLMDLDQQERFIFTVKCYYEALKKDGKIK